MFDRIRAEQGRLDLLVNNVWGGYEDSQCRPLSRVPFWEQSFEQWDRMFTAGVRAHLVASRLAVPLMLPQRRGLIASTTANLEPLPYLRNIFYDMCKSAIGRMTWAMAQELREHGIGAVAIAPGFMRTERVVEAFRRAGALEALNGPGGPKETTAYLGRAIVALASDPRGPCEVRSGAGSRHPCAPVSVHGCRRIPAASVSHPGAGRRLRPSPTRVEEVTPP